MTKKIVKAVLGGAILGAIIFFTGPFLFLFIGAVLLLKFIFTPFGYGRMMMWNYRYHHMNWVNAMNADKIRSMSDEEFQEYKSRNQHGFARHPYC